MRDSYASAEHKAAMVALALFGVGIPGGFQVGYASLVDLRSGLCCGSTSSCVAADEVVRRRAGLPGSPTDVLPSSQGTRRGDGEERRHQDIAVRIAYHWPTSKVIASPAMIRAISVSSTRQAVAWLKIGASRRAP